TRRDHGHTLGRRLDERSETGVRLTPLTLLVLFTAYAGEAVSAHVRVVESAVGPPAVGGARRGRGGVRHRGDLGDRRLRRADRGRVHRSGERVGDRAGTHRRGGGHAGQPPGGDLL